MTHAFEVFLAVRLGPHQDGITIRTDGSIFDSRAALARGLMKLVDVETDTKVDFNRDDDDCSMLMNLGGLTEGSLLTIPPRNAKAIRQSPRRYDHLVRLQVAHLIKNFVIAGRRYRRQLTSVDLGIEWWTYTGRKNLTDAPPLSEPYRLVPIKPSKIEFVVVESLAAPPPVSVSLSLSSNLVHRSGDPPMILGVVYHEPRDRTEHH